MFTGIVEELGTVQHIARGQHSAVLTIQAKTVLEHTKLGDSIAVNGICLTVTKLASDRFSADVMHETLNRSALAQLSVGSPVNLERAMAADGRFGGHIVAGHVDGVGRITNIRRDDNGISLTVAAVGEREFSISAIPHTVRQTVLHHRRKGDLVNLETDIIGKYIEKLLQPAVPQPKESTITRDLLSRCGF